MACRWRPGSRVFYSSIVIVNNNRDSHGFAVLYMGVGGCVLDSSTSENTSNIIYVLFEDFYS